MTATGHAVIGTFIAARFSNPYISLPLSFVSHIFADMVPHWDSGTHFREKTRTRFFYEAVVDVIFGFIISFAIFYFVFHKTMISDYVYLFLNIISAQLLDWLSIPSIVFRWKNPLLKYIERMQSGINSRLDKPWGIVTQFVSVGILYVVLFWVF